MPICELRSGWRDGDRSAVAADLQAVEAAALLVFLPFFLLPTFLIAWSTVARSTTLAVGGFTSVGLGRVTAYLPFDPVVAVPTSGPTVVPFT